MAMALMAASRSACDRSDSWDEWLADPRVREFPTVS
jgi:hypothetical protein